MLGLCLLFSYSSLLCAKTTETINVQMSWRYQFQFAPFIAAVEKGFYKQAGLDVHLQEGGPGINAVDTVTEGKAQYGVFSSALLVEYTHGKPVVALAALMQHSPVCIIYKRDSGISSPQDLTGRKIAVSPDTRDVIHAYLEAIGLKDSQILLTDKKRTGLKDLDKYAAISGYTSNEGYYVQGNTREYGKFYPRSAGIDLFGNILFTSREHLRHQPEEVAAFIKATLRGLSYALEHQTEIATLIHQRYNTQNKSLEQLLYEAQVIADLNQIHIIEPGYMSLSRWQKVNAIYAKQRQVPPNLNLDDFIYNPNPNKNVIWLYWTLFAISIVLFITASFLWQARRYNRRLVESESRFRDLFEKNPDPCWIIENNILIECNEQAARILGYSSVDALRNRNPATVSPQYQPDGRTSKEKSVEMTTLALANGIHRYEWEFMRRNGETLPVEVTLARIRQAGREVLYCVWRDITERKIHDRIKNEFVSTVSHELRTPLTAIRGTLKFLNSGRLEGREKDMREMLRIAESNSDKLLFLINDLLDIEKLENGDIQLQLSKFDLREFLHETAEENASFARQYQTSIELCDIDNTDVIADQQRLKQVMANLLSNACKYSPPNTPVEVRANRETGRLMILVSDKGPGIPTQFHSSIFDKFTQADSSSTRKLGGTGLGLAIVKRIVELHGGKVGFITSEHLGTTFEVILPN